ncbi:MAG: SAM-dependent methyltransferase [Campylobacterales bacterium]|nr:SAM-dependent methyltransferase [Campylobacterales bacterium]
MKFSNYMNEWLYGKEGYYQNFKAIGKSGDFYTAVSTSSFFGASIANFIFKQIEQGKIPRDGYLIEIGAHQGYLICDMIQWLYSCDSTLIQSMKFAIVERQPKVQAAQKKYIYERFGDDVQVEIFSSLDEIEVEYAFFISNEIFDAFGCELIKDNQMAYVEDHQIVWGEMDETIAQKAQKYHQNTGEIAVGYESFALEIAQCATHLDFVSFDYGEKYVRNDFSIRIYKAHTTLPLFDEELKLADEFKQSDITFDVNFAHVIDAFSQAGMNLLHYETQARALVRFGIIELLEMFAKQTTQTIYAREADKIKTLLAPTMMGDRFKMVHLKKF